MDQWNFSCGGGDECGYAAGIFRGGGCDGPFNVLVLYVDYCHDTL